MKNRKNANKGNRYNGYNVFRERCEMRTVKINPENALKQCLEIFEKVEIAQAAGRKLEYTLDWSAVPKEETRRIIGILERYVKMRNYHTGSFRIGQAA